jgi:hypothetical protein
VAPGVPTPHEISGFVNLHPSGVGLGVVDCHWVWGRERERERWSDDRDFLLLPKLAEFRTKVLYTWAETCRMTMPLKAIMVAATYAICFERVANFCGGGGGGIEQLERARYKTVG